MEQASSCGSSDSEEIDVAKHLEQINQGINKRVAKM